jgi:hypothetical protein
MCGRRTSHLAQPRSDPVPHYVLRISRGIVTVDMSAARSTHLDDIAHGKVSPCDWRLPAALLQHRDSAPVDIIIAPAWHSVARYRCSTRYGRGRNAAASRSNRQQTLQARFNDQAPTRVPAGRDPLGHDLGHDGTRFGPVPGWPCPWLATLYAIWLLARAAYCPKS